MKKIILLTALLLSAFAFAQKTVYVFNFSSHSIEIGEFETKHATTDYPRFKSYGNSVSNPIHVPALTGEYVLSHPNNSYFPFYSPNSTPYIPSWYRRATATSSWTTVPSNNLNNVLAASQVFRSIKFQVGLNGEFSGTTLGGDYPLSEENTANGWTADVSSNTDFNNPQLNETVFVIFDL